MQSRFRSWLLLLGFFLFLTGMVSLILSLVGIRLTVLGPIDELGFLWASVIKLVMVLSGVILVYFLQSNR
ncbi:MAG TPA: hypothetical protein VFX48_07755 [Saprospiraceae bacterium]|nr:hypothetical protein [Saprospiraceae bacterium]